MRWFILLSLLIWQSSEKSEKEMGRQSTARRSLFVCFLLLFLTTVGTTARNRRLIQSVAINDVRVIRRATPGFAALPGKQRHFIGSCMIRLTFSIGAVHQRAVLRKLSQWSCNTTASQPPHLLFFCSISGTKCESLHGCWRHTCLLNICLLACVQCCTWVVGQEVNVFSLARGGVSSTLVGQPADSEWMRSSSHSDVLWVKFALGTVRTLLRQDRISALTHLDVLSCTSPSVTSVNKLTTGFAILVLFLPLYSLTHSNKTHPDSVPRVPWGTLY